jgi:hypothetical protein
VWIEADADPWGYSVRKLIDGLQSVDLDRFRRFTKYERQGNVLDRFSIPTRYPNGLPDLTPEGGF